MHRPTKPFLILHFEFLIVFLPFAFCLLPYTYADYADGDGSPEFPFQIAEPNQLIYMSQHPEHWSQHFILTADINLALADPNTFTTAVIAPDTVNFDYTFQGTPFTGTFDGNGPKIYNLTIDDAGMGRDYLGLFGRIESSEAVIKDLGLENTIVNGGDDSWFLGGLCGMNFDSVSSCYTIGSVTGGAGSFFLSGLCARNTGDISNCYFLDSAGPDNGFGKPLDDPNIKIQSSFVGWDFVGDSNGSEDH